MILPGTSETSTSFALDDGAERRLDVINLAPWKKGWQSVGTFMETDLPSSPGRSAS